MSADEGCTSEVEVSEYLYCLSASCAPNGLLVYEFDSGRSDAAEGDWSTARLDGSRGSAIDV